MDVVLWKFKGRLGGHSLIDLRVKSEFFGKKVKDYFLRIHHSLSIAQMRSNVNEKKLVIGYFNQYRITTAITPQNYLNRY